jgi:hypothetical protein
MTQRERESLKSSIGSSVGVKGFFEIKAKVEGELSKEVEWESSYEVAREFNIIPPKCGWKEIAVYQLVRVYDFRFTERSWFGGEKEWSRTFKERTERYSGEPLQELYDPKCDCPARPKFTDLLGRTRVLLESSNISVSVLSRLRGEGIQLRMDDHDVDVSFDQFETGSVTVPASWVPDYLRFLGDLPEDDTPVQFALTNKHAFIQYADPLNYTIMNFESQIIRGLQGFKLEEEEMV